MNDGVDGFLGFISKKRNLFLIGIIILGIVLRIIVASNVEPIADEMNVAVRSIGVHNSGTINSVDESHSFYFLNEIVYFLSGNVNLITARFVSIIFGLLSVLMIYLLVVKLYKDKRLGLVAAFLAAISGYQIRFSLAEMDIAMAFFVLLSSYCFVSALYERKDYMFYVSAMFLALAIAIKTFAGIWVLSYLVFGLYYAKKNSEYKKEYISKKGFRIVLICAFIVFFFLIPTIVANYLLYKDKGIVDLQVARYFGINKGYYAGLAGIDSPFSLGQLATGTKAGLDSFWRLDPLLSILALIGLFFSFKINKEATLFFFSWFIFAFLFIAGTAWLETHFVFHTLIFSVFAGGLLVYFDKKIRKKGFKQFLGLALIIILVFNVYWLSPQLTSQTAVSKMRTYAEENIQQYDLVVVDSRVFRGRTAFMFNDKFYVEASYLPAMLDEYSINAPAGKRVPIRTFFIECAKDDCGWGNVKDNPELNASMENAVENFKEVSELKTIIYGGGGANEIKGEEHFKVYQTLINADPTILTVAQSTHTHYLYPVGWEGEVYDRYEVRGFGDTLMNNVGFAIFYFTIFLEVVSIVVVFWFYRREEKLNRRNFGGFGSGLSESNQRVEKIVPGDDNQDNENSREKVVHSENLDEKREEQESDD